LIADVAYNRIVYASQALIGVDNIIKFDLYIDKGIYNEY